jgi:hypothetical protein
VIEAGRGTTPSEARAVTQMDSALVFEAGSRRFESCRVAPFPEEFADF